jgi:hypothetical protein
MLPGRDQPRLLPAALQDLGERAQPVAHEAGLLEPLALGERGHAGLERSEEPVRPLQGGEEVPDELCVALGVHPAVARCRAPAHVGERARREAGACAHGRRAAADRLDLLEGLLREPAPAELANGPR